MSKHTPGPWGWWDESSKLARPKDYDRAYLNGGGKRILSLYGGAGELALGETAEDIANARLIAASPELLVLADRVAKGECEYGNGADCNMLPQGVRRSPCLRCQARVLLAKVEA